MSSDSHGASTLSGNGITSSGLKQPYHLVDPSPWPILGALTGAATLTGLVFVSHYGNWWLLVLGLLGTIGVMFGWWRDVLKESATPGMHSTIVRLGLRYGVIMFIASEVMFFVGFFWAFFHYALFPEHVSGAEVLVWPPQGVLTFDPWGLPFLNTMILLLSGTTLTWAHHALLHNDRKSLLLGLTLTVVLGVIFTGLQAWEYSLAPFKFFGGGVYPSVFFLATGFHGFHVIVGTLFLAVCLWRAKKGHFTPERHFGFEAAAWYWHFVDVVWLFLFICIYWWGAGEIAHH
jgi:cytochrome c oxidase subunit III